MARQVKLSRLDTVLGELDYPIAREDAIEQFDDVTLLLADGEENLGEVLRDSSDDTFESREDLANEVLTLLPQHAVGEPYQSEGEG